MFLSKIGLLVFGIILLFPGANVYGHGLGIDTISSVNVQGKKISISVEVPFTFEPLDEKQITITATDDKTKEHPKNVTFLVGLFHENEMIFRYYFFTPDGVLPIKVIPTSEGEISIQGEKDSLLGAWHGIGSNPIEITGPIFNSGGLYSFEIEVRTIDEPTNIVIDSNVHHANLIVVDTSEFLQKDINNNDIQFKVKSYFDKIYNLTYDSDIKQLTFEMPFDWSEKQMSHIPVVHEEVHIPKDFDEFFTSGYTGKVNGIDLFKASVTIDDYTAKDERIVHFVLLQDHLNYLKNQIMKSGDPLPDKMIFTLLANDKIELPLTAFTKSEDFQVSLSWDPIQIEPGQDTIFVFTIRDGKTGEPKRNSDYTFVLIQNGKEIFRNTGTAQVGGDSQRYTFSEDQSGPTIVKFENIRKTGQETEFSIVVVPEFGPTSLLILFSTLFIIVLISKIHLNKFNFNINLQHY